MTQILNLLHLAPAIQEELLFLPVVLAGTDPMTERDLRPIVTGVDWGKQRGCGASPYPVSDALHRRTHRVPQHLQAYGFVCYDGPESSGRVYWQRDAPSMELGCLMN